MKTLEEFVNHEAKFVEEAFAATGEIMPMWVIDTEVDGRIVVVTPWGNGEEKEATVAFVTKTMREKRATRYVLMTEAWEVIKTKEEINPVAVEIESIANHPDRREIVLLTAEDHEQQVHRKYYILRPENGKPKLSPGKTETIKAEGRMMGLLKRGNRDV